MTRWTSGAIGRVLFQLLVVGIFVFLLAAPSIVVYYSFSPTVALHFPPDGFTWRWYLNVLDQPRLLNGVWQSGVIAGLATMLALLLGVPTAYALTRGTIRGRRTLETFFLSPLILPGLVLGIGILMFIVAIVQPLVDITLVGSLPPLLAAHLIVTVPWVIRTVMSSLNTTDVAIEEAARGLGATPLQVFWLVTLPSIKPGIVAGALFAFIVSFGNFALSLFFASGRVTTLPVAIFEYVDRFQDPTVAAISTIVIGLTMILVLLGDRFSKIWN